MIAVPFGCLYYAETLHPVIFNTYKTTYFSTTFMHVLFYAFPLSYISKKTRRISRRHISPLSKSLLAFCSTYYITCLQVLIHCFALKKAYPRCFLITPLPLMMAYRETNRLQTPWRHKQIEHKLTWEKSCMFGVVRPCSEMSPIIITMWCRKQIPVENNPDKI